MIAVFSKEKKGIELRLANFQSLLNAIQYLFLKKKEAHASTRRVFGTF